MTRSNFDRGTFLDAEEFAYPAGSLRQSNRRARALCSDGIIRTFLVGIADTYFSIPARGKVKGKTVTGYISMTTRDGSSFADEDNPAIVIFTAYAYGKNSALLPGFPGKETA